MDLQSIQKMSLDLVYPQYRVCTVKANDVDSRFILMQITDAGTPFAIKDEYKVKMKIKTPDQRLISLLSYDTEVAPKHINILEDGRILIQLSTGVLLKAGSCDAELSISNSDGTILSSMLFSIKIVAEVYSDDELLDDSEVRSAVAQLIAELTAYSNEAKAWYDKTQEFYDETKQYAEATKQYAEDVEAVVDDVLSGAETAKKDSLLSRSYATGDSGISTQYPGEFDERIGEATDSSKYYYQKTSELYENTDKLYEACKKLVTDTVFSVNLETGELEYESYNYEFGIDEEGNLTWGDVL